MWIEHVLDAVLEAWSSLGNKRDKTCTFLKSIFFINFLGKQFCNLRVLLSWQHKIFERFVISYRSQNQVLFLSHDYFQSLIT